MVGEGDRHFKLQIIKSERPHLARGLKIGKKKSRNFNIIRPGSDAVLHMHEPNRIQ